MKAFRKYGVPLQVIRIAARNARGMFNTSYPFTCHRFQSDGKTIFWEAARETGEQDMLDLRRKQFVFEKVIRPSLYEGIEFGVGDRASCWFPMKRSKRAVLDPTIAFGKPIVTDTGVCTDILYEAWLAENEDKQWVARQFEVPVQAVNAAILFEERIKQRLTV